MFHPRPIFFILFALLLMQVNGQSVTMLTYNIRYDNPSDGLNGWLVRKFWLGEQIHTVNPDVFAVQEGLAHQVMFIDSIFPGYRHIGIGREDGKSKGEFSAIWYKTKKVRLIRQGTFWLSATPEKVSVGWDAALERICTFGLFKELSTGQKFWVFNTHFDHQGVEARKNSATLILQKIKTLNKSGYPVILTGDFNTDPGSEPYQMITGSMTDSKSADKSMTMGPDGTFNGFDASKQSTERIDFIFTGYGARAESYFVIRESRETRFASDHFPVVATIKIDE